MRLARSAVRGRLKIYSKSAAGVGKSYRMLQEAHELRRRGVEMVALLIVPPRDSPAPSFRLRLAIRLLHRLADWEGDRRVGCLLRCPATDLLRRAG